MAKITDNKKKPAFIAAFVIMSLAGLTFLLPLLWVVINSFKTPSEFILNIWSLPKSFNFKNYTYAFNVRVPAGSRTFSMFGMLLNSLVIMVTSTAMGIFIPSMTAYALAKYRFKYSEVLVNIALIIMTVPIMGTLASTYKLLRDLRVLNTYFALILLGSGGLGFGFLMLYNIYKNLSWSYAESAFMDGASDFRVFIQIMMPHTYPLLIAQSIMGLIAVWNDYFTPFMFMPNLPTVAVGLELLFNEIVDTGGNYPAYFASMTIVMMPVIIVFAFLNKKMMDNLALGGLKG